MVTYIKKKKYEIGTSKLIQSLFWGLIEANNLVWSIEKKRERCDHHPRTPQRGVQKFILCSTFLLSFILLHLSPILLPSGSIWPLPLDDWPLSIPQAGVTTVHPPGRSRGRRWAGSAGRPGTGSSSTCPGEGQLVYLPGYRSLAWSQQGFWQPSFCKKRSLWSLCLFFEKLAGASFTARWQMFKGDWAAIMCCKT